MGLLDRFSRERAVEIEVYGVACRHCKRAVRSIVESLGAVSSVSIETDEGRARVRLASDVDPEALVETIRNAGYEARLA